MITLFFYVVALIAYTYLESASLSSKGWPPQDLIGFGLGFLALLVQVHQQLSTNFLQYYFLWTRIKQRLTNPTSKWSLNVDFRGDFEDAALDSLKNKLAAGALFKYPVRIFNATDSNLNFAVNDSLQFFMELHRRDHGNKELDQCAIRMATIEIGSNSARQKLECEIVPIFDAIRSILHAEREAYTLNIDFMGANPFFSRYMQHLRADDIADFKIALQVTNYTAGTACERVEIDRKGVSIVAHTATSMKELAKDFLFQSPNLNSMLPLQHHG